MALPAALQHTLAPPELELVASEHLVDIVPLVSMERTAFVSVSPPPMASSPRCIPRLGSSYVVTAGRIRPPPPASQEPRPALDGLQPEAQEKMPHRAPAVAHRRSVALPKLRARPPPVLTTPHSDFLQEKLAQETSRPEFSRLPFRFAEIAKVLLDMCVPPSSPADEPPLLTIRPNSQRVRRHAEPGQDPVPAPGPARGPPGQEPRRAPEDRPSAAERESAPPAPAPARR